MKYVNHSRQNVQEFLSVKGFVKPVREWYPPTAVPNPPKYPDNLPLGRLYLSPGQKIQEQEKIEKIRKYNRIWSNDRFR